MPKITLSDTLLRSPMTNEAIAKPFVPGAGLSAVPW
jgi:hypothetical protein